MFYVLYMKAINQDPLGISGKVVFNTSAGCVPKKHGPVVPNYTPFLQHNLCTEKDMIGSAGTAIGTSDGCSGWCGDRPHCTYFGVTASPTPWCIAYSDCTPRNATDPDRKNDLVYTVYRIETGTHHSNSSSGGGGGGGGGGCTQDATIPNPNMYVVYVRPLFDGSVAVGLMNRAGGGDAGAGANTTSTSTSTTTTTTTTTISLDLALINVPKGAAVHVRDVWAQKNLAAVSSGVVHAEVCAYCTTVLKVSLATGAKIDYTPWV